MAVKELKTDAFNDAVSVKDKLIVIDFWASWCGPCRMLSPILDKLSDEMTDVIFYKVNTDEEPALAGHFQISSIPTVMLAKDQKLVDQFVGYMPEEQVRAKIEAAK